ncbi:MAG: hypothetical protein ACRDR6_01675 [Pseudonocardiaceae bacterium]
METGGTVEAVGPPWLLITIAGISFLGVVVTAVVGPLIVERFRSRQSAPESPESSAIAHGVGDAVALIQSAIGDLQTRIGRLEMMQMTDAHEHRG